MRKVILAHFRKWNSFNHVMREVKFGTDWADSLLNALWVLYIIFHIGLIHKSLDNIWASLCNSGYGNAFMRKYITEKHLPILRFRMY